ncbi:MAG: transcription elongation factor GreA [Acidimicrobiales bacterium]
MAENIQLTQATFDRLKEEHAHLTTVWRIDIAKRIEAARELGDLKENGDYHAAKEEQGQTEARIRDLEAMIERAEIVEGGSDDGTVAAGSVVSIRYEGDDDVETYLLGSIEEKRDGIEIMSPGSPIGQALVGAQAGDVVEAETPGGTLRVEIVSVGA